jgi:hypothetical protein
MPIPTSQSFLVSLRFTLNPQVTECPYQLPSHCSSLYVLLSVHKSLNAHNNFPVIFRLSPFYCQSTSHWMPISNSQSIFVFLRFTLSPQVTECPYQLSSHCSVFNASFNNISVISWWSVLLWKETGGPCENYRHVASHWQTLSHNGAHLALIWFRTHKISYDRHW